MSPANTKPPAPDGPGHKRTERLATALRANLRRRKAQARAKEQEGAPAAPPPARTDDTP